MMRITNVALMCASVAEGVVQLRRTAQQGKTSVAASKHVSLSSARADDAKKANASTEDASFVMALDFAHSLRVCNAFPSDSSLEIFRGKEEKLTAEEPMSYKDCRDFKSSLTAGDKLEFRIGEQSAGTFSVTNLPESDAVLFLVIHRHDAVSTAVAFDSHVFASMASPQVAIIDTYKGKAHSVPRILDGVESPLNSNGTASFAAARSEMLRYDSVVAVNQGIYEVELDSFDGKVEAKSQLVALQHESYVVLRTGVEAKGDNPYPQELIVFPQSDPAPFVKHSFASRIGSGMLALILAAFVATV